MGTALAASTACRVTGVWHTDQCSHRVVGLEGCATMSSSARQVVRGERRSLQASLKLAAEKSLPREEREPAATPSRQRDIINAGRSSIIDPSPVPAFERSKQTADERNRVLEAARRETRQAMDSKRAEKKQALMADEAREIAEIAEAAVEHKSLLAAEVEVALMSPTSPYSSASPKNIYSPSKETPQSPKNVRGRGDSVFTSPRSQRNPPLSPRSHSPAIQMQSAQEILNRIEQLEAEQKMLDKTQKQQKESIIANQQEALYTYRSVDSVEPDELVAAAVAKVRMEVLDEIVERVESTVEQDIRSVSKVLVDKINDLTVQLESERAQAAAAAAASASDSQSLRQRMEHIELEERKRKDQGDGCNCMLQ